MSEQPNNLKDDAESSSTEQKPENRSIASKKDAQIIQYRSVTRQLRSSRQQIKRRRRLVLSLHLMDLEPEEIQEALESQGVTVTVRCVYKDLAVLRKQLETLDRKALGYTFARAFWELKQLSRELWSCYHNPNPEVGHQKFMLLRELRNLNRAKTRLAGLTSGGQPNIDASQPVNITPDMELEILRRSLRSLPEEVQNKIVESFRQARTVRNSVGHVESAKTGLNTLSDDEVEQLALPGHGASHKKKQKNSVQSS